MDNNLAFITWPPTPSQIMEAVKPMQTALLQLPQPHPPLNVSVEFDAYDGWKLRVSRDDRPWLQWERGATSWTDTNSSTATRVEEEPAEGEDELRQVVISALTPLLPDSCPARMQRPHEEYTQIWGIDGLAGDSSYGWKLFWRAKTNGVSLPEKVKQLRYDTPETEVFWNLLHEAVGQMTRASDYLTHAWNEDFRRRCEDEKNSLLNLFNGLLSEAPYYEEVPNEYGDGPYYQFRPWLKVHTPRGPIVVGWRKRVINIDWSQTVVRINGATLFPKEDTTTGGGEGYSWRAEDCYIHADGYVSAGDYLRTILSCELPSKQVKK